MGVMQADSIARLPNDTTRNKLGVAVVNNNLFIGDGSKWIGIGGSTSGIDSVTFNSSQWVDTVKYWSGGSGVVVGYIDRFDGLISGGKVTRTTGRTFQVTSAVYSINGSRYLTLQTNVTVDVADDSARFDIIAANTGASIVVIKGSPSRYPIPPAYSNTQVPLAFVYVSQDTISVIPPQENYWAIVNGTLTNTNSGNVSVGGKLIISSNTSLGGEMYKTWNMSDGGQLNISSGFTTSDLLTLSNVGSGGRKYGWRLTGSGDIILRDYTGGVNRMKVGSDGALTYYAVDEALFVTSSNGRNIFVAGDVNATHNGTSIIAEDDNKIITLAAAEGVVIVANSGLYNGVILKDATTVQRTQTLPDKDGTFAMLSDVPSGGGGGLDSAGVRSIVSDSIKTMVSGDGILFEEITPDSVKVSVDTAWLSAKIDSALARGPKIWIGLVSQTGTDDPTAIVLENTTGDTLKFQYLGGGKYKAYFDTFTFGANKVWGISSPANSGSPGVPVYSVILKQQSSDYIEIWVGTADDTGLDGQLYNTPIEIKFYQ